MIRRDGHTCADTRSYTCTRGCGHISTHDCTNAGRNDNPGVISYAGAYASV